jgi:hypothetical protein
MPRHHCSVEAEKYERGTAFIQTVIMTRDHMGVGREKEPAYAGPPWMFKASDLAETKKI